MDIAGNSAEKGEGYAICSCEVGGNWRVSGWHTARGRNTRHFHRPKSAEIKKQTIISTGQSS